MRRLGSPVIVLISSSESVSLRHLRHIYIDVNWIPKFDQQAPLQRHPNRATPHPTPRALFNGESTEVKEAGEKEVEEALLHRVRGKVVRQH